MHVRKYDVLGRGIEIFERLTVVFIISGPVTQKFIDQNPVISRTIEIRGDQTLADLHRAIFKAFDREEEHLYEFQIGGKGPNDPNAKQYGLPTAFEGGNSGGDVTQTAMDDLNLKVGEVFGYWFDFGDDWWHQINVTSIEQKTPSGDYPKVTKRVGASPRSRSEIVSRLRAKGDFRGWKPGEPEELPLQGTIDPRPDLVT